MVLQVRAQHTTSRVIVVTAPGPPRAVRVVQPARRGDAHLVDESGQSLCGQDASAWRTVTGRGWRHLREFWCDACAREAAERRPSVPGGR